MIEQAVKNWEKNKHLIEECFRKKHPENYAEIVKNVITHISDDGLVFEAKFRPDPERIYCSNDDDYNGTLWFIIGHKSAHTPYPLYEVSIEYGSCSVCDTYQEIRSEDCYNENTDSYMPTEQQIKDYMTLSLHVVQSLKVMEAI